MIREAYNVEKTTTDTTTNTSTDEQNLSAEQKLERQEGEDAFAAGYEKVAKKDAADAPTDTTTTTTGTAADKAAGTGEQKVEAAAAPAAAAAEDPWKDVSPALRKTLETMQATVGEAVHLAKSTAGRVGTMQAALDAGRKAAEKAGTDRPSDAQVAAAIADPAAWKKFEEDFPDFANPVKAQFDALHAELSKVGKGQTVDVNDVSRRAADLVNVNVEAVGRKAREFAQVDVRHEGWEETVKSPEFDAWAYTGGPTKEERAQLSELERTDQLKYEQELNAVTTRYPQWWSDRGAKVFSDRGRDAIALLDSYKADQEKSKRATDEQERQRRRLHGGFVPTGGAETGGATTQSDDQAFQSGFNAVRKKK